MSTLFQAKLGKLSVYTQGRLISFPIRNYLVRVRGTAEGEDSTGELGSRACGPGGDTLGVEGGPLSCGPSLYVEEVGRADHTPRALCSG